MKHEPIKKQFQRSRNRWRNRRDGIVLLIVLGMLSLFTVLIVSFVVFKPDAPFGRGATRPADAGRGDADVGGNQ